MKCLKRNKQKFYVANPNGLVVDDLDENGNLTGNRITLYGSPVQVLANISPATGIYKTEEFGAIENYDKVILTDDLDLPITENSAVWIDKAPSRTNAETYRRIGGRVSPVSYTVPVPDYMVWRISKSLNALAIAVKKIKESPYGTEEPYPR